MDVFTQSSVMVGKGDDGDLPSLVDDIGIDIPVYSNYGTAVEDGDVPYREIEIEYPPGALPAFAVPALVAFVVDRVIPTGSVSFLSLAVAGIPVFLAAYALSAEEDEARQRVRIAAAACADEHLRAALEEASAGELSERALRRLSPPSRK